MNELGEILTDPQGMLGIDRESERLAGEAAAELGIAPAPAAGLDDCLPTRFVNASALDAPALALAAGVEEIAHALRRFHDSATTLPSRFSVPNLLASYAASVRERGGTLPDAYAQAQAATARIAAALPVGVRRPCHNDLRAASFIRASAASPEGEDGRLLIVGWEYAGMGDPRFDLGNLSMNNAFDPATDERLLTAYHGRAPSAGERAAHRLMRVLSDARAGAWGVLRACISELDFDFDGYAREHFARMQATVERREFERWLASASAQSRQAQAQQPLTPPAAATAPAA